MKTISCSPVLFVCLLFFSCQKPTEDPAQPPSTQKLGQFTVTISNRLATSANLTWTAAVNTNNADTVKYKVQVTGAVVASDLTSRNYTLTNLVAGNSYSGRVMAYTKSGDTSSAAFTIPLYTSTTPNYSYVIGYYKVTEATTNITTPSGTSYYTFAARVTMQNDSVINFIQSRRVPQTWWTLDFPTKIYPAMNDSLMWQGATPRGRILDPSTIRMSYLYGTTVVYSVKQLWQKLSNPADTALIVYNYPNLPGMITTVAGNYIGGSVVTAGDGGPATKAVLSYPDDVAMDNAGNIYLVNGFSNKTIRKVSPNGIITTIAGTATSGFSGDGGPAVNAQLDGTRGLVTDNAGNLFLSDVGNRVIRKITPAGIISTIAGTPGVFGHSGDGGPATSAQLKGPAGMAIDAAGNIYFADAGAHVIRKISTNGIITTVAGSGVSGNSGDGGVATSAKLQSPSDVAVDAAGNLYIADNYNHVIRKVTASTGIITTIAGTMTQWGFSGDGGPATAAKLRSPYSLVIDAAGNIYFSDNGNDRIRKIAPNGIITTIAGNGQSSKLGDGPDFYGGDYGMPLNAAVFAPKGIYWVNSTLYIATNHRIRKVSY